MAQIRLEGLYVWSILAPALNTNVRIERTHDLLLSADTRIVSDIS